MNITDMVWDFHQGHPLGNIAFFDTLDDAHWRTRPHPAVNSLAWLIRYSTMKGYSIRIMIGAGMLCIRRAKAIY